MLQRHSHDIASAGEPCVSVPDTPFGLEASHPQPLVREGEPLTAVVVFSVIDSNRPAVLEDGAVGRHTVWNVRDELSQMERGVGVMTDTEQEHLPVQIAHAPDRALGDMRRKREWVGRDPRGVRSRRREGLGMIATPHPGQPPERIRDDAEIRRHGSGERVEGLVRISRPGRHHQSAGGTESAPEGLDQPERPSFDRPDGPEGGVHQKYSALLDSERAQLIGDLGPPQLYHHRLHFPRNSPIGSSDSIWSQAILSVAIIGTARIAPGTPQMYHQKIRPMKSATVLSFIRLP